MKYRGLIIDRMNSIKTKKTRVCNSYQEAHETAEKANKIGERGTIAVKTIATVEEYVKECGFGEKTAEAVADVIRKGQTAGNASFFYGANIDKVVGVLKTAENDGIELE